MWTQLNVFYNRVLALRPRTWPRSGSRACAPPDQGRLRRPYRHHRPAPSTGTKAWCFYQLGAAIECADQTDPPARRQVPDLRRRRTPTPARRRTASTGWRLLRSAAGYQAFRRRHPRGMGPEQVAAFLLCPTPAFRARSPAASASSTSSSTRCAATTGSLAAPGARAPGRAPAGLEVATSRQLLAHDDLRRFADASSVASRTCRAIGVRFSAMRSRPPEPVPPEPPESSPRDVAPRSPAYDRLPLPPPGPVRPAPGDVPAARQPRPQAALDADADHLAGGASVRWVHDVFGELDHAPDFTKSSRRAAASRAVSSCQHSTRPTSPDYLITSRRGWPFDYGAEERPTSAHPAIATIRAAIWPRGAGTAGSRRELRTLELLTDDSPRPSSSELRLRRPHQRGHPGRRPETLARAAAPAATLRC